MQKKRIALAVAAAFAGAAHAEDGVQLYGILDVGVAYQNHSYSASDTFPATINNNSSFTQTATTPAAPSITTMVNGPMSDSRWGIKGSKALPNDWSVSFALESGINLPTGQLNNAANSQAVGKNGSTGTSITNVDSSLSGQLFNRTAHVGLTYANMGTVDFGRNYAPGYDVIGAYDPQKGSQLFSPLGFSGSEGGALGYTEVLRNDNSVKYTNKFGNVNVRAIYKFGNVAGVNGAGSGYGLNVGYEASNFGVQAVVQSYKDVLATSGATFVAGNPQGVSGTLYDTQGWMLTGKYVLNELTLKAGYQSYKRKASSDTAATIGSMNEFGYVFSTGTPANLTNYVGADKQYKIIWLGGDYNLTSNLNLGLAYYRVDNMAVTAFATGAAFTTGSTASNDAKQNFYSAVLDYNFDKSTDVYFGAMFQNTSGTLAAGVSYVSVATYAGGVRYRF